METYFYVVGISLVLIALAISFMGMRSDTFPSTGVMRAGVAFVALVVVATAYGAIGSAQDEQSKREAEANRESAVDAEETTATNAEDSGGGPTGAGDLAGATGEGDDGATGGGAPPSTGEGSDPASGEGPPGDAPAPKGDPAAGMQVFLANGCGSCHTLSDAGSAAMGQIGPNLDAELADQDAAFIETSIADPSAEVEKGFSDGIMPQDYASKLSPEDLADLVAYLSAATSGSK